YVLDHARRCASDPNLSSSLRQVGTWESGGDDIRACGKACEVNHVACDVLGVDPESVRKHRSGRLGPFTEQVEVEAAGALEPQLEPSHAREEAGDTHPSGDPSDRLHAASVSN